MAELSKTVAIRWRDVVNLVLGVWLFVSPWILQYTAIELAAWNAYVLGVIIAVAAIAALVAFHEWEEWADMAFGLWLIVSPWVLGFATLTTTALPAETGAVGTEAGAFAATWNFIVVGALTLALAAWSVWDARRRPQQAT